MYVMVGGYSARSHAHGDSDAAASVQPQSSVLSALPLYFLYGHCVLCYQPLTSGDLIVQMPAFELDSYLAAIGTYKISRLSLTPAVLYDVAAGVTKAGTIAQSVATGNRYDIGSVKMIGCGGASLPHALKQSYSQIFNGSPILQGYGMAESTSIIAGSSWTTPHEGAVGVLYPNSSGKVIDSAGQETDGFGELCVSGPHVMRGYVNTATSPVVNGFLRTGDYARVSSDGHVFLRGRIADIVYTEDGVVVPTDVENALASCPLVSDCAVKGEGPKGSARTVAYIVPSETPAGADVLQRISQWARSHTGVSIECRAVEAIPKSPAGKVLRYLLGKADAQ
ncbi:hypothetical protein FBU59_004154 [Linderina macrospora]|uniref:Uncharacterized protein n=1 Tax=Linderina macrospora TaxID=4868 RepID=A0ACC1J6I6_9FUNG|nr:hypothetical protein FBU59_004154 [Linderina macrospora]